MTTARTDAGAPASLRLTAGILGVAFAFPALYLLWRNASIGAPVFDRVFSSRTMGPAWRTLQLAVLVSSSAAVLGTALAWLTTRTDIPGRRLAAALLPLPLVFPTFIGAAAFIRTMNPGGVVNDALGIIGIENTPSIQGLVGAWFVLLLFTYPYVFLPVAARLRQLPGSLEETSRFLGDSSWETFRRVVLPQLWTAIGAGTLLVFLYAISDFGAVQLLRYDTLTRAIETNWLSGGGDAAFALAFVLLLLAGATVVAERTASRRLTTFSLTRSGRPVQYELGRATPAALAGVWFVLLTAIGAPMLALGDWAIDGLRRGAGNGRPLTIDGADVASATWNTLWVSVITAVVALAAVLPIAFLYGRHRSRVGPLAHALVISTFALPGVLIALSLRFWSLQNSVLNDLANDSSVLLIFSYTVRFGSLAMGVALIAVRAVPETFADCARSLGANSLERLRSVDLPLMRPGLLAGGGLVLLSTMKELPISFLLSPIGFSTLATRMFGSFEDSFVGEAGILAVVLVALSSVLTWFLVLRRADHL